MLLIGVRLDVTSRNSAVAVVRRNEFLDGPFDEQRMRWPTVTSFDVVRLTRFPRGTRYREIVENVVDLEALCTQSVAMGRPQRPIILVDATATGRPPVDLMVAKRLAPVPVQMVESGRPHFAHRTLMLPRPHVVTELALVLGDDRLAIDPALDDAQTLVRQLEAYPAAKPDADTPDDLALAVALPVWWGRNRCRSAVEQPPAPRVPVKIRTAITFDEACAFADERRHSISG